MLLFDLALEPLARCLEDTDLYEWILVRQEQVKLPQITDDVNLFLDDLVAQLPGVFHLISQFGTLSGYKFNMKSELLELTIPLPSQT